MSITVNSTTASYSTQETATSTAKAGQTAQTPQGVDTQDTYEKSQYSPPASANIQKMKDEMNQQIATFTKLVEGLLNRQAGAGKTAVWNLLDAMEQGDLKARLEGLEVDSETQAKAAAMVAEDGYFGVEQTAQRIVDFAKALSGGDTGKIDILRKAVDKGFDQAKRLWGGNLPDISQKTYDRVQELFNDWAGTGAPAETETEA